MTARTDDAGVQDALALPLAALRRCQECWDDGQGSDVKPAMMDALTAIGWIARISQRRQWEITPVGLALLDVTDVPAASAQGGGDGA